MANLAPPWDMYVSLQQQLDRRSVVDSYAWGMESGLNRIVASDLWSASPIEQAEIDRKVQSSARNERKRTSHREVYPDEDTIPDPARSDQSVEDLVQARETIRIIQTTLLPADWDLLQDVCYGVPYKLLAAGRRQTEGALRVRVSRIRSSLIPLAA